MGLDIALRKVAQKVIRQFGQEVTLYQRETGKFVASSNTVKVARISRTVTAVVVEYTQDEPGGAVRSGDKRLLIAAKDLDEVPRSDWRVRVGERDHEIVRIRVTTSGQQSAMYEIAARGA